MFWGFGVFAAYIFAVWDGWLTLWLGWAGRKCRDGWELSFICRKWVLEHGILFISIVPIWYGGGAFERWDYLVYIFQAEPPCDSGNHRGGPLFYPLWGKPDIIPAYAGHGGGR